MGVIEVRHRGGLIAPRLAQGLAAAWSARGSIGLAVLYVAVYGGTDWFGFVDRMAQLNITPWNPPPGTSIVLLMLRGFRWAPLLAVGPLFADLVVRHLPAPLGPTLVTDFGEACVYTATVWAIRRRFKVSNDLTSFRDVVGLIVGVAAGACVMAVLYVGTFLEAGMVQSRDFAPLVFEYWVGDTIGILVTAPVLLVHRHVLLAEIDHVRRLMGWDTLGQAATLALSLWLFFVPAWSDGTHAFYVLFVPLVWVAAKRGLSGVTVFLVVTQFALLAGARLVGWHDLILIKLQFLMLTLAITGLMLGVIVSEREAARQAVSRGECRLRTIVDMTPDALLVIDEGGRIEVANKVFERLSGLPSEQAVGCPAGDFIISSPLPSPPQTMLRHVGGGWTPIEVSVAPLVFGGQHGSVVTARDISERKLIEQRNHYRRSTLEQAARVSLGEKLAASLAHELNQPLSALIGYMAICQRLAEAIPGAPERLHQQMGKAVVQAERAGAIVSRLSEFYRSGRMETAAVRVSELITDVVGLFVEDAARIGAHLEVKADAALVVRIDRLQTELVLVNLLRNGLDSLAETPGSDRWVELSAERYDDGFAVITVADNGHGIAEELAPDLFDAFVTARPNGMGLGLAISQSIVTSHGGRLWCDPTPASGARFHFTLPLSQEDAADER